jgi:hypothetical protein
MHQEWVDQFMGRETASWIIVQRVGEHQIEVALV